VSSNLIFMTHHMVQGRKLRPTVLGQSG